MASSIAVASGKGDVGKTSIAVNLGLTLARQGRRSVLLDADFGMANSHMLIGEIAEHMQISDEEMRNWEHAFRAQSRGADLTRAVLQGVAFAIADATDVLRRRAVRRRRFWPPAAGRRTPAGCPMSRR